MLKKLKRDVVFAVVGKKPQSQRLRTDIKTNLKESQCVLLLVITPDTIQDTLFLKMDAGVGMVIYGQMGTPGHVTIKEYVIFQLIGFIS